jgi:SAM-dependent methyltransferase
MVTTTDTASAQRDALVEQLLQAANGVFDIFAVYLGDQLGLYRALRQLQPATSPDLANAAGLAERYVREWLEQQTVAGIVTVDNPDDDGIERRFRLPAGHDEVLTDSESLNYLTPLAQIMVGVVRPIAAVRDAFRTGAGVPYADFGSDMRRGQGAMNRNMFLYQLGPEYLAAIPDVHARLTSGDARIADIGCGLGWSSIGMAQTYPHAHVDGFDLDEASVEEARANAVAAGLDDRVQIHHADAAAAALAGRYDLGTAFECVHDMADPVGALATMRRLAGDRGTVLVMDERTSERFTPEGNEIERLLYGFSLLHCLPAGMADRPSVGTGTVMRPATLRGYAREAGFRDIEILPLDNFFFRFYRLVG